MRLSELHSPELVRCPHQSWPSQRTNLQHRPRKRYRKFKFTWPRAWRGAGRCLAAALLGLGLAAYCALVLQAHARTCQGCSLPKAAPCPSPKRPHARSSPRLCAALAPPRHALKGCTPSHALRSAPTQKGARLVAGAPPLELWPLAWEGQASWKAPGPLA